MDIHINSTSFGDIYLKVLDSFLGFQESEVFCVDINSGVAVGAGWQALVAYVNIGCYYIVGVPLGILLGYKFNLGAKGIWSGMISGTLLHTVILLFITWRTDWNREASEAEDRIKVWGGSVAPITDS